MVSFQRPMASFRVWRNPQHLSRGPRTSFQGKTAVLFEGVPSGFLRICSKFPGIQAANFRECISRSACSELPNYSAGLLWGTVSGSILKEFPDTPLSSRGCSQRVIVAAHNVYLGYRCVFPGVLTNFFPEYQHEVPGPGTGL